MNKNRLIEHLKLGIEYAKKMTNFFDEAKDAITAEYFVGRWNAFEEILVKVERGEFDDYYTHSNI